MKKYLLGTSIKITVILSEDNPDSIKITIEDSAGQEKVSMVNMSLSTNNIYYYVYQSDDDDNEGTYTAIIEVTKSGYTSMSKSEFILEDATAQWSTRH